MVCSYLGRKRLAARQRPQQVVGRPLAGAGDGHPLPQLGQIPPTEPFWSFVEIHQKSPLLSQRPIPTCAMASSRPGG